ncbi:cysteine proteinase inhibitor 6 isoform X2 [Lactuca sativa]|uniref:cysteine proteinase inhibitor 6 isoform X2 n=1 Tax=Lactuca sativa TaxID=4236 RepID=UPI000CD8A99C|nr:cysteine proteinase inhibitor 6 isoform X2 [Lactuca sativa]
MQIQRYNYILLLLIASSLLNPSSASKQSSFCSSEEVFLESNPMATLGGIKDSPASNSAEIDGLARFAVDEHNKKENKMLELARVVKVQEQVVSGTLHHLTLEVVDVGEKKLYLAKIWVKPWLNFKELQEFTHIGDATTTSPNLDVQKDDESMTIHGDFQDAASHALKTLQQRSNSLFPYELQEVVHVKAETVDGTAKYDLVLKVKRSDKEEKFKANVHKDKDGNFHVNNMVQDHS